MGKPRSRRTPAPPDDRATTTIEPVEESAASGAAIPGNSGTIGHLGSSPDDANGADESQGLDDAAIDARIAHLQQQKSRLEKIREMRRLEQDVSALEGEITEADHREAAGGPPDDSSDGSSSEDDANRPKDSNNPERRRHRNHSVDPPSTNLNITDQETINNQLRIEASIKVKDPPLYYGKSVKEHRVFVAQCENVFNIKSITYRVQETRIRWATQFFRDDPFDIWGRYEQENGVSISWGEFKKLLLDWVKTPANRHLDAAQKFEEARQGPNQTVRNFALYLQTLEDRLEPYSEAHKKQHLLSKLRPEITRGVMALEHMPATRDDMIEAAARIEENLNAEKKEKRDKRPREEAATSSPSRNSKSQKTDSASSPSSKSGRKGNSETSAPQDAASTSGGQRDTATTPTKGSTSTSNKSRKSTDLSKITCYNCNEKGHYQSNCPKKASASAVATAPGKGQDAGKEKG